jgi:hypothetical protein
MMRSGVADQPERKKPILRPFAALTGSLLDIFVQAAWLLTASSLPSHLRTQLKRLWRIVAREMTVPRSHHSKRPRKAKSPRPF